MPSASWWAGAVAAFCSAGSMKWTWVFQKAAVMVAPLASTIWVPGGKVTSARGPSAAMRSPSSKMAASEIGAASGLAISVAPTKAR